MPVVVYAKVRRSVLCLASNQEKNRLNSPTFFLCKTLHSAFTVSLGNVDVHFNAVLLRQSIKVSLARLSNHISLVALFRQEAMVHEPAYWASDLVENGFVDFHLAEVFYGKRPTVSAHLSVTHDYISERTRFEWKFISAHWKWRLSKQVFFSNFIFLFHCVNCAKKVLYIRVRNYIFNRDSVNIFAIDFCLCNKPFVYKGFDGFINHCFTDVEIIW